MIKIINLIYFLSRMKKDLSLWVKSFMRELKMKFSLNQKVVYPGYGVAQIVRIFEKNVASSSITFCELKFLNKNMTVMVPLDSAHEVGIRPLSSHDLIKDIFTLLTIPARKIVDQELSASTWNRRNKEYQNKLKTGSLRDISDIYKDLKYISQFKELSFGEKTLLTKAEMLLAEEISAAETITEEKVIEQLRSPFMMSLNGMEQQY